MSDESQKEEAFRKELCEIGHRLWQRGLVAANDGNISLRLNQSTLLCTPSGVSKGYLRETDLVVIDMNGTAPGTGPRPSSELKMHLTIYQHRPDVRAVVHAHPPHATALALLNQPLPRYIMPEMEVLLGPMPLLPYHTPGTREFADAFLPHIYDCDVFLLSNHGATAVGRTLEEAWYRMESLDQCCRILLLAMQAGPLSEIPQDLRPPLDTQRADYRTK